MKLYVKSSRGYQQTDGMDQDTVIRLLTELGAKDIIFVTEEDYNTAIVAQ